MQGTLTRETFIYGTTWWITYNFLFRKLLIKPQWQSLPKEIGTLADGRYAISFSTFCKRSMVQRVNGIVLTTLLWTPLNNTKEEHYRYANKGKQEHAQSVHAVLQNTAECLVKFGSSFVFLCASRYSWVNGSRTSYCTAKTWPSRRKTCSPRS